MKDVALFLASICAPATLWFFATASHREDGYICIFLPLIQIALFSLARLWERYWWVAYGLGFGGILIGHVTRIIYDSIYRLYDHNLFPIELVIIAVADFIFIIIGMGIFLLVQKLAKRKDE
jgi:hypothetical protein